MRLTKTGACLHRSSARFVRDDQVSATKPFSEIVLLVEPHGDSEKLRGFILTSHRNVIIERCHLASGLEWIRTWICTNDERALTGQRIFREQLPPPPPEPVENPIHDEMLVTDLPFTATETPLGWERGALSPQQTAAIAADPLRKHES